MALGVLQDSSWVARGWVSKSFFVRFWYSFRALLRISWKLDDEAVGG